MPGNMISIRITSGLPEIAFSTASSPVAASKVSYPPDCSSKRTKKDLTLSLSSTIKTFLADMSPPHLNSGRDEKDQLVRSKAHGDTCFSLELRGECKTCQYGVKVCNQKADISLPAKWTRMFSSFARSITISQAVWRLPIGRLLPLHICQLGIG